MTYESQFTHETTDRLEHEYLAIGETIKDYEETRQEITRELARRLPKPDKVAEIRQEISSIYETFGND